MTLFQHQIDGAEWLAARGRGYLADPPGLGKTRTLIAAAAKAGARKLLIACPAIVRTHWAREVEALDFHGDVVFNSYDTLVRGGLELMAHLVHRTRIDALVLDEAHYCKHATSKRTQLMMGKDGYARRVPLVFAASGTPMPKNPAELWTQLCFLTPEVLKAAGFTTQAQFVDRFCITAPRRVRGQWIDKVVGTKNEAELRQILDVVMLRREKPSDVPPMWWQVLRLDPIDNVLPELGLTDAYAPGCDIRRAIDRGQLDEIANDPHVARIRRRIGELKVAPVAEMVKSQLAESDDKIALFAHHRSVLHGLREMLGEFGVAYIDGEVSQSSRASELDRFRTDPRCRVFVGQNIACGTGMDGLQYATNRILLVEPDWTATNNEQLGARVDRTGQTRYPVVAQMVALAGTIDEAIVGNHHREVRTVARVLGKDGVA